MALLMRWIPLIGINVYKNDGVKIIYFGSKTATWPSVAQLVLCVTNIVWKPAKLFST
jgi:hypothetical protein